MSDGSSQRGASGELAGQVSRVFTVQEFSVRRGLLRISAGARPFEACGDWLGGASDKGAAEVGALGASIDRQARMTSMAQYRNALPQLSGDPAIEQVDEETAGYPCYYMINCAHPTHFEKVLAEGAPALRRIRGLRANASRMSHAELNESTELDTGNAPELG